MSIKIDRLSYTYLKKTPSAVLALDDVSLEIPEGKIIAFVGKTGSGKSTLMQHLNGLLIGDSGHIQIGEYELIGGKRKNKNLKQIRKHVGVVFQFPEYQLFEDSVEKDVAFGPKNFGLKEKDALEKAHKALLSVGIKEEYFTKSPFELSGGEKRRVAIAGILAIEPDILVLDEPTAGLDPLGQKEIMNLVKEFNKEGKTIILVTHDMDLVAEYADIVYVMKDAKVVFTGTPAELFSKNREDLSIEIPRLYQMVEILKEKGFDIDSSTIRSVDDLVRQIKEKANE